MAIISASTYPNKTLYDAGAYSGSAGTVYSQSTNGTTTPHPAWFSLSNTGDTVYQMNAVLIGGNGLNM
jgi:hypothetical protein